MKTKIGKHGIFAALTAVLLVTTVLITSCSSPSGGTDEYQLPAGMGSVKISINDNNERAILPGSSPAFTSYALTFDRFAANAGGVSLQQTTQSVTTATTTITLAPGWYELSVIASTAAGAIATGATTTRFEIVTGSGNSPLTVYVSPYNPTTGTGTGTFTYTINLGGVTPTSLTMTITTIAANDTYTDSGDPQNITAGSLQTISSLPTGYYYVDIVLTVGADTARVRQVLHIYQNQTSNYTYTFDGDQIIITSGSYSLTIDYNAPANTKPALEDSSTTTVAETARVTLDIGDGDTETITVNNASAFTAIAWYCNSDTALTTTDGLSTAGTINYDTLDIEAGTAPFDNEGLYHVTVIGTAGGLLYSTYFYVEIVD